MSHLERYQTLMLEHVYGLLEPNEVQELEAYLATPEGASLRELGERWKHQISSAAKADFKNVSFHAPAAETPSLQQAITSAASPAVAPKSSVRQWLVAAGILLAVAAGIPAARQFGGWYQQSRETQAMQLALNDRLAEETKIKADHANAQKVVESDFNKAQQEQQALLQQYENALVDARKVVEQKDFMVRLTGPDRVQPGAPNEWKIETLNKQGVHTLPRQLDVIVKDKSNREIFHSVHNNPVAPTTLKLPIGVWEKVIPGTELYMEVVAYSDDQRKSVLAERVPLARPVFVTQLVTDKPLYRPGETIRFRSLTLDRASFLPPDHDMVLKFRLRDPAGAITPLEMGNGRLKKADDITPVLGPDHKPLRGLAVGEYTLGEEVVGGEYNLDILEIDEKNLQEKVLDTRKFLVNRYVPDVFEKKLEFDGKSYGPGDNVQARIEVSRTAGGALKDARANVSAFLNGNSIHTENGVRLDSKGVLNVRFKLPEQVGDGNATLSVNVLDGSDNETISRPIPVVGNRLNVEFFPEGGDLVDGVPSRVYFQVRLPNGKPADLKGTITDGTNNIVDIATMTDENEPGVNRGLGVFRFTPKLGKQYFLKINRPVGIETPNKSGFPLPSIKDDGVVLTTLDSVTGKGDPIRVRLQVGKGTKSLHVGAYSRGNLIAQKPVEVTAGKPTEVALQGADAEKMGGVTRVTVFEAGKAIAEGRVPVTPKAERLVFRKQSEQLKIAVHPDKMRYTPAGKVNLELQTLSEADELTPAVLMIAVVNQSVIRMADMKTDRLLPTQFLLAGDVKHPADLEHADFLLTDHPKAGISLDLFLGTQGWRRFAEQIIPVGKPEDRPEVERMLVAHGQRSVTPLDLVQLQEQKIRSEFVPQIELMNQVVQSATNRHNDYYQTKDQEFHRQIQSAEQAVAAAKTDYDKAAASLYTYETRTERLKSLMLPLFLFALIGLSFIGLMLALLRPQAERKPYWALTAASFGLCALTLAGTYVSRATNESSVAFDRVQQHGRAKNSPDVLEVETRHAGVEMKMEPKADAGAFNQAALAAPAGPGGGGGFGGGFAGGPGVAGGMPPPAPMLGGMLGRPEGMPVPGAPKMAAPAPRMRGNPRAADLAIRAFEGGKEAKEVKALKELDDRAFAKKKKDEKQQAGIGFARGLNPEKPFVGGGGGMGMGMPAGDLRANEIAPLQTFPFVVREYAHQRDVNLGDTRSDFTETVFWHPVLVVPDNGKATVSFQLSDDIARYQVLVAGHTLNGRIGAVTQTIEARKPFTVDPKVPLEISSSDIVDVPVRFVNDSDDRRAISFTLKPKGVAFENATRTADGFVQGSIDLQANQKGRKVYRIKPDSLSGNATLEVIGISEPATEPDGTGRVVKVVPDGFPGVGSISDMLEKRAQGTVVLPKDVVKGTLQARLEVYPTSMSDLVKGLEGLMREPGGCFEQTSTSNYPNTLILEYLNQTNQVNPEASLRAKQMLDRGYAILVGYECPDSKEKKKLGFEWFGAADMAHEALTAYGLLQFKDMAKVHSGVDPDMVKRTQAFLLSRRDGKGGFLRNARALDSFGGAPKHTTDAYITWALVESDPENQENLDLKKEIAALKEQALKADSAEGKDSYFVALVANTLLLRDDRETALVLLDRLQKDSLKDGHIVGAQTSITRSGGRDLEIEATALTMLGWLKSNENRYATAIKDATRWISQQRGGYGGFGSTQSTILALKALITHARKSAHPAEAGEVVVKVNGKQVATKKFTEKDVEVIALDIENPEAIFKAGEKAEVEITTDAKHPYPFSFGYTYTSVTPVSAEKCGVQLATKLSKNQATEGETVPLNVNLVNKQKQGQGMSVAVIGIPAGMKVPTDMKQLTALKEKGSISYFETQGRELILYWRELAPEQKIDLSVDLVCDIPGEYRGPASRGYLYYNADHKHWVEPLSIKILPGTNVVEAIAGK